MLSSRLDKRPIKVVSIEGRENGWSGLSNMLKEPFQQSFFVGHVEDSECPNVVILTRCVLEVSNIFTDDLPIGNQKARAVHDVGDHHYLVVLHIGKLERLFGGFNIESENTQSSFVEFFFEMGVAFE